MVVVSQVGPARKRTRLSPEGKSRCPCVWWQGESIRSLVASGSCVSVGSSDCDGAGSRRLYDWSRESAAGHRNSAERHETQHCQDRDLLPVVGEQGECSNHGPISSCLWRLHSSPVPTGSIRGKTASGWSPWRSRRPRTNQSILPRTLHDARAQPGMLDSRNTATPQRRDNLCRDLNPRRGGPRARAAG